MYLVGILSIASKKQAAFQPFQCPICQSRFTRHENLKRHAAVHSSSQDDASLSCHICNATFSRPDLRLRHLKRKHPNEVQRPRKRQSQSQASAAGSDRAGCQTQQEKKSPTPSASMSISPKSTRHDSHSQAHDSEDENELNRTSSADNYSMVSQPHSQAQSQPQSQPQFDERFNAVEMDPSSLLLASFLRPQENSHISPATVQSIPYDNTLANFNFDQWSPDPLLSLDGLSQIQDEWMPSSLQQLRGCDLFFTYASNFLPFLHQPTFQASRAARPLLLGILCLGYQYGEDPDAGDEAGSGSALSLRCFHRARALIAAEEDHVDETAHGLIMVQTYILLQVFAMMYSCDKDSAYGLKTHSKICSLARAIGLMNPPPNDATVTEDLDSLWRHFVQAESHKRTLYAVHQIDTLWYQFLSIPRSLSHLEIKQDLPCPETYWTASSSGEWAHRQLVARHSGPPIRYHDAVRRILASDSTNLSSIPAFDPYGTINITQFLVSSAREISGWSTMTGMLSMERLDPLRKSLLALSPLVRAQSQPQSQPNAIDSSPHAALCETTWQAAMIEMQMWSPSHTGGLVGTSVDAALHHLIDLAPSCEFLCESNLCGSIQPHVDWFLRYLDQTVDAAGEAPWLTLYACKAFMIAWQLVRGGMAGAMQVVGVADGDREAALKWAKKVFERRERWKLGKIVMACLEGLDV
ncbi:hypothetical protein BU24DRAFT_433836 [Aaosphaeria arxii CBS 175.79]|uniref:C2H2-type domain-containing protein n=1 Tax=Aaosphaeria arxii CBS 175.79 TaxID=1450172 RepID=A0A6A5XNT1_9PLEO|nr:uncharacterized protein BU24DRAFT_433836 [Aaosphaeria arxii CBS 175.79]KAF2014507.1 hypothetical protein BU24DRAFT_433836 [Aaosphaeria arxii CBS 175.79]